MSASRAGAVAVVKTLLAHGANIDAKEHSRDQTALMWAVAQQHAEVVKVLVEAGADFGSRTRSRHERATSGVYRDETSIFDVEEGGFTPLLFASRNGDVASADILLAAGANVNDRAAAGMSALVVAIHSGQDALANLLLQRGADVNDSGGGYTALHIAVRAGKQDLVKILLDRRADINAVPTKPTPAHRSANAGNNSIHYSFVGASPLWMSARLGNVDLMRLLIARGASPSFVAPGGRTVLMAPVTPHELPGFRASESRSLEVVKLAIEYGNDVEAATDAGDTALHGAAKLGYNSVVQFLVDNGAKVSVRNSSGQSPLMLTFPAPAEFFAVGIVDHKSTGDLLRRLGAKE
jgi:ankyrin repeat protein